VIQAVQTTVAEKKF